MTPTADNLQKIIIAVIRKIKTQPNVHPVLSVIEARVRVTQSETGCTSRKRLKNALHRLKEAGLLIEESRVLFTTRMTSHCGEVVAGLASPGHHEKAN
jgi:hypothetical protein